MSGAAAPTPTTPRAWPRSRSAGPAARPEGDEVKAALRANTDAALARGLFGVPTIELDGRLFWGLDALPMLAAALRGDAWFDGPAWDDAAASRAGVQRRS